MPLPPTFVSSWDSGLSGATWDSGLQWDTNVGPSLGDVSSYLELVAAQHKTKPKFIAFLTMLLQPLCDLQVLYRAMTLLFNLDSAAGVQLDAIGEWIGVSRNLTIPLANSFFSWNTVGLGWNEGSWRDPLNPVNEVVILPDDAYRTLLRARAANNIWDGTIPGAYAVWDILFAGTGYSIDITDDQDMTLVFTLRGPQPDAITLALLNGGYLALKPAGVSATYAYTP